MFTNAMTAKTEGQATEAKLIAEGVPAHLAASLGRQAEAATLKELDAWTVANVGLD